MRLGSKQLFFYPFLLCAVLTVLVSVFLEFILRYWLSQQAEQDLDRVIVTTFDNMKRIGAAQDDMQLIAENVGLVSADFRISILDLEGRVLGDSDLSEEELQSLNSLNDREEIQQARIAGQGSAIRQPSVSSEKMKYLARRFKTESFSGIIRVSTSFAQTEYFILQLRFMLGALSFTGLCLVALFLTLYSRHLSFSVNQEKLLLEKRVDERTSEIQLLQRLASLLAACQSPKEIEKVVADIVPRILGDVPGAISLINASRNLVELSVEWGKPWPAEPVYALNDCWALRTGKSHFSKDRFSSMACTHMGDAEENTLCIPLVAHGEAIGLMHLLNVDEAKDCSIAYTIAEHLGLALANIDMQNKLKHQAIRDPLTGLYNRRHMEETLEREINRASRRKTQLGLLLLDLDHFKQFNDNFGHDAGDFVLKSVCSLIKSNVRKEDAPCRIGGEELAVILPDATLQECRACAEKLVQLIRRQHLAFRELSLGTVTASIGVSIYPTHAEGATELIKSADNALYLAKSNGRDQFSVGGNVTKLQKA